MQSGRGGVVVPNDVVFVVCIGWMVTMRRGRRQQRVEYLQDHQL